MGCKKMGMNDSTGRMKMVNEEVIEKS